MTVVILDRTSGALPPYPEWLRGCAADLVLFTSRPTDEVDTASYAEVHPLPDNTSADDVEQSVLRLAERTRISAIVATAGADLVRAGTLRDLLGLPGQGRDEALLFADPVAMRDLLGKHGIQTVPCGPVQRVSDLAHYADRWGYPLRLRQRRPPRWATVAVLRDRAELHEYADGLSPGRVPSLFAEPWVPRDHRRLLWPAHRQLMSTVDKALTGIPSWSGYPYHLDAVPTEDGDWLVDTIVRDVAEPRNHRETVRAQAGLLAAAEETLRWAA